MPHARGEKSSAWNGQAATNQTPNLSQYVLVLFHLISRAIRPLQPTPSSSLFFKIQDKTTPKGRVHFHHDTRPLKTRLVTLPPLQTKPHLGTTPSLVIDNFWVELSYQIDPRGAGVRIENWRWQVFNGRVSWWKCTRKNVLWIPIQILYIHGHFKLRNIKLHVLMIKLTHWAWAACAPSRYSHRYFRRPVDLAPILPGNPDPGLK